MKKHNNTFNQSTILLMLLGALVTPSYGNINVYLDGIIDLDTPKSPTDPYIIEGRVTGETNFRGTPIVGGASHWSGETALIGIQPYTGSLVGSCVGPNKSGFLESIPGTGKYGFPLVFTADKTPAPSLRAWIVLKLNYSIQLKGSLVDKPGKVKSFYTGTFFEPQTNGLSDTITPAWNVCFTPGGSAYGAFDGEKNITIGSNGQFEIYTSGTLTPGKFTLVNNKIAVVSLANQSAPGFSGSVAKQVVLSTNLKIVRVCKIKNVTQSTFDVVMGRTNQELLESRFQYTCTANNSAIYISAASREGDFDTANPRKLYFNSTTGNNPANNRRPWLMGLPYKDGEDSEISCKQPTKQTLLKFNNEDALIGNASVAGQSENLNIKWAVCADENTTPGKYRARVEVAIFTKV